MMTKSIEQLRNHTWASRAAAIKELKQHGLKEQGDDYFLTETGPESGVWYLADRTEVQEDVPIKAAAKKSGPKPGRETLPKRKRSAAVQEQAEEAEVLEEAREIARDMFQPEPEPGNDMSPLPADGGPYGLMGHDAIAQHSIVETALAWSRKIGERIAIVAKGKVVRVIDGRIGAPGKKMGGGLRATGKSAEAVRMLMRDEGATKAEIMAMTEWSFTERWINRLANTRKARVVTLGKDHWRLVKDD